MVNKEPAALISEVCEHLEQKILLIANGGPRDFPWVPT